MAHAQASAALAEALAIISAPAGPGSGGPLSGALPPMGSLSPGGDPLPPAFSTGAPSAGQPRISDALAAASRAPASPGLSFMQALAWLAPSAQLVATPPQRSPETPPAARPPAQAASLPAAAADRTAAWPLPTSLNTMPNYDPSTSIAEARPAGGGGLFSDALLESVVQRHLAQRGVPPLYMPGALAQPAPLPAGLPLAAASYPDGMALAGGPAIAAAAGGPLPPVSFGVGGSGGVAAGRDPASTLAGLGAAAVWGARARWAR